MNDSIYALVYNNEILLYPVTEDIINERNNPNENYLKCFFEAKPEYNENYQRLIEIPIVMGDIVSIRYVVTNKAIDDLFIEPIAQGLFANIPVSGKVGELYLATDQQILYRYNGSSWVESLNYSSTPVFGSEFNVFDSMAVSSTNSTAFQTKLSITTGVLPAGTYRIHLSYLWYLPNRHSRIIIRLLEDSVQKDSQHIGVRANDSNERNYNSNLFYSTFATNTTHTYSVEYRRAGNNDTAFISDVILELWRVA